MLKLFIEIEDETPLEYEIRGDKTSIGRSHDNDFRIKNSYVSAFHAEIHRTESGAFEIADLGSFNGTFVNGKRVERSPLAPGDAIKIGMLKGKVLGPETNGTPLNGASLSQSRPHVAPLQKQSASGAAANGAASRRAAGHGVEEISASSNPDPTSLQARLTEVEAERDQLRKSLEEERTSTARLEREAEALKDRLASVPATKPVKKSGGESRKSQADLEEARLREARQTEDAAKAGEQAERLARVEAELNEARTLLAEQRAAADGLRDRVEKEAGEQAKGESVLESARKELAEAKSALATSEARVADLTSQFEAATRSESALKTEVAEIRAESDRRQEEIGRLEARQRESAEIGKREASEHQDRIEKMVRQLESAHAAQAQLEADLKSSREAAQTLQEQLSGTTEALECDRRAREEAEVEADRKIAQLHARISELKLAHEQSSTELAELREQSSKAQSKLALSESIAVRQLAEAQLAATESGTRFDELQARFEAETKTRLKAEKELAESKKQVAEEEKKRAADESARVMEEKAFQAQISDLTSRLTEVETNREKSEQDRIRCEADLAEARARIAELKGRIDTAEMGLSNTSAELEQSRTESASLRDQLAEARAEISRLDGELADSRNQLAELEDRAGGLTNDLSAAKSFTSALERDLSNREEKIRKAQADLESERAKANEGARTLAAELDAARNRIAELETKLAEQESAISGATGDQAATVRKLAELQAELDHAQGRMREAESTLIATREETAGVLAERDRIRADFEVLAAESGGLESIKAEKEALGNAILNERETLAALREDIAAAEAEQKATLRDLSDRQDQVSSRLSEQQAKIAQATRQLEDLQKDTADAGALVAEKRREIETVERELQERRSDLISATADLERLTNERDTLDAEKALLTGESESLKSQVKTFTARLASLAAETDDRRRLQADLDSAESRLAAIESREAAIARSERQLEEQLGEQRRSAAEAFDLGRQIDQKRAELDAAEKQLERKLHELKLAEDRIQLAAELDEQIDGKRSEIQSLNAERETVARDLASLTEECDHASRALESERGAVAAPINGAGGNRQAETGLHSHHPEESKRLEELREQIAESEGYHKILRESLRLDHATVQILSRKIIRKLDLIEDLISTYRGRGDSHTVGQLEALKESFLDLLRDNSIQIYSFDPGTEISIDHRRLIQIVETRKSSNGTGGPARIFATIRPGYLCTGGDSGDEQILRKAEVITHG